VHPLYIQTFHFSNLAIFAGDLVDVCRLLTRTSTVTMAQCYKMLLERQRPPLRRQRLRLHFWAKGDFSDPSGQITRFCNMGSLFSVL
jgi:hypothetical protein